MIRNVAMKSESGSMVHTHWYMTQTSQPVNLHSMPFSSAAARVCFLLYIRTYFMVTIVE